MRIGGFCFTSPYSIDCFERLAEAHTWIITKAGSQGRVLESITLLPLHRLIQEIEI